MPMINFTQPFTLFIGLVLFVLVLFLAKNTKKSFIIGIMLFTFIALLIGHTVEFGMNGGVIQDNTSDLITSIIFDLIFILISFISYLWIDDVEAKLHKKKSIDNSLDWFWDKV